MRMESYTAKINWPRRSNPSKKFYFPKFSGKEGRMGEELSLLDLNDSYSGPSVVVERQNISGILVRGPLWVRR
jgi:hypothetical protein